MSERDDALDENTESVMCIGTLESPHEPRKIVFGNRSVVRCTICDQIYRRPPHWSKLSGATWPKAK